MVKRSKKKKPDGKDQIAWGSHRPTWASCRCFREPAESNPSSPTKHLPASKGKKKWKTSDDLRRESEERKEPGWGAWRSRGQRGDGRRNQGWRPWHRCWPGSARAPPSSPPPARQASPEIGPPPPPPPLARPPLAAPPPQNPEFKNFEFVVENRRLGFGWIR